MTAPTRVMATRKSVLTTAKALDRALCQAEFDTTATDSAPFFSRSSIPSLFGNPGGRKEAGEAQTT